MNQERCQVLFRNPIIVIPCVRPCSLSVQIDETIPKPEYMYSMLRREKEDEYRQEARDGEV